MRGNKPGGKEEAAHPLIHPHPYAYIRTEASLKTKSHGTSSTRAPASFPWYVHIALFLFPKPLPPHSNPLSLPPSLPPLSCPGQRGSQHERQSVLPHPCPHAVARWKAHDLWACLPGDADCAEVGLGEGGGRGQVRRSGGEEEGRREGRGGVI